MEPTAAPIVRQVDADPEMIMALRRTWTEEQAGGALDDPGFEDRFAQWFAVEAARRATFVAELGGRAVGMVNIAIFERMPRPATPASRWCYLANAFVLAGHRGQGTGAALMAAVVEYARAVDAVRIVLAPTERSKPFYARAGFVPATMLMVRALD